MIASPNTPIVADLSLARRLERAEGSSNAEFVEARAQAFPDRGAEWIQVAGVYAMFDGVDSPCTQTFGLGLFETVAGAELDQLEQFFLSRGADVFHEACPLIDESLVKLLNERGYQPFEFSNVLFQPISTSQLPDRSAEDSIEVRLATGDDSSLWARTAARGWADVAPELGDYLLELEAIQPYRRNTHNFLARRQGEAIAAGALCLHERVALLAGACTVPEHRKQGAQRALLEHRLRYGAEHGCDLAMMVAAPGSSSQRNAERQGFRIAYTRIKWRLSAAKR
jgi:GNAT superfamily N-acetyltransferase